MGLPAEVGSSGIGRHVVPEDISKVGNNSTLSANHNPYPTDTYSYELGPEYFGRTKNIITRKKNDRLY